MHFQFTSVFFQVSALSGVVRFVPLGVFCSTGNVISAARKGSKGVVRCVLLGVF